VKKWCAALAASTIVLATAGCDAGGSDGPSIVVYNAQHEQLISEIAPAFTKKTGIKVELRNGSDSELAAQLEQEGDASPADVFLTENSPAMSQVERAGLLRPLPNSALAPIPAQYRPRSGLWTGFVGRSTVLVYNTEKVQPSELPTSLMDLADPAWKGRVSFSPTGADFQAIVSAVLELKGEKATRAWLAGLKANGTTYDGNNVVLEAVNAGRSDVGIIYHYYWYRDQAESGAASDSSKLHFFGNQDPGAFLSVSGAGVLKSSKHPAEAQQFVKYLNGPAGQKVLADSKAMEYPIGNGAKANPALKPLSELQPPTVAVATLNGQKVVDMMTAVGFL